MLLSETFTVPKKALALQLDNSQNFSLENLKKKAIESRVVREMSIEGVVLSCRGLAGIVHDTVLLCKEHYKIQLYYIRNSTRYSSTMGP